MESRQVTGAVLIAGVLAMIVGVAAHPHHGPVGSSADVAWQNLVVAVIIVGGYGTLGVGFMRLLRSMSTQLWNDVAGVALAFAGICGAVAAVVGHVVVPRVLAKAEGDPVVLNDMVLSVTLAQTSLAAWAIGMIFLSIGVFRGRAGWKFIGATGGVLGLCILTALTLGWLEFSLHNVGLVALASGIWISAIGLCLATDKSFGPSSGTTSI